MVRPHRVKIGALFSALPAPRPRRSVLRRARALCLNLVGIEPGQILVDTFTDRQLTMEVMEHAARSPATATRTYARIANASRDDSRRAGGTAPGGTNPATDRDHRWPAVIRAKERRAQDTGADDFLRGVAMGCRGASRRIEIRSREHGGGEARIPAAPDLHISLHPRGAFVQRARCAPPLLHCHPLGPAAVARRDHRDRHSRPGSSVPLATR